MGILIGMDEAGYGPNLGPLVVAATAWEVADEGPGVGGQGSGSTLEPLASGGPVLLTSAARPNLQHIDLYRLLRRVVAHAPDEHRIAIADSKRLYKPGHGLRQLERGVHTALGALRWPAACWSDIVAACDADAAGLHRQLAWHDGFDCRLPVDATSEDLETLTDRFARACEVADVQLLAIRARLVFPGEFNELVEYHGTKGAALSHVTIGLLREVLEVAGAVACPVAEATSPGLTSDLRPLASLQVVCDKHGGRNRYHSLLAHFFPDQWIDTLVESRAESRYHWGPAAGGVEVAFRAGGEAFLPAALASMTAKYLRELAMRAFNEFWCARVPGLRPTAGYPADAPRFKAQIEVVQRALGIDDHVLWRNR